MQPTKQQEFWLGVKDELPILVGVIPFGMIYGILALSAGMLALDAQAMSAVIFAGSSQFMVTQLLKAQTPIWVIIITAVVINLRHALYSATLSPYTQKLSLAWKTLLSYLLTDEAFAVAVLHYQKEGVKQFTHWYFFGAALALWTSWQLSTALGIFLGAQIPAEWGLDFALPLTFIALVVPTLKDRAGAITAVVAYVAALLLFSLPLKLGLLASILVAIVAGMLVDGRE